MPSIFVIPFIPFMIILSPIGKLYGLVMDARNRLYDRGVLASHALGARTISVGNITTGGTGKTPLVALISEILLDAGETVCILTRGYGRENQRERVLVSDGQQVLVDAARGGDEPVELAERFGGRVIIVADSDRLAAGRWAKEKFGVTAFVLDDGFQHRRVKRDVDIVCVDATDPCGGGRGLPAGRLRERLVELRRADAIVLTRTELVEDASAIEVRMRRLNPEAPIFRAETRISRLISLAEFHAEAQRTQSEGRKLQGELVGAFCALGNPDAFFRTMDRFAAESDSLGIQYEKAFEEHHSYKQEDINEIEQAEDDSLELLVTTAKDAVKLQGLRFSVPCYVAIAETVLDDVEAFRRMVVGGTHSSEFHL